MLFSLGFVAVLHCADKYKRIGNKKIRINEVIITCFNIFFDFS